MINSLHNLLIKSTYQTGVTMHRILYTLLAFTAILVPAASMAQNQPSPTEVNRNQSLDGVIKLYGACGPQNALRKVADAWERGKGAKVKIICGPEPSWSKQAQVDADIIWGTSEQSMTAFLQSFPSFPSKNVVPIYLRPAIIAVKNGNPRRIQKFADLLQPGIRIVVTEGSGIANTSGTGTWEDIAGRLGKLEDVKRFRRNIVAFSTGSGASFKAFKELDADAWITWPEWAVDNPKVLQAIPISSNRSIWRDLNIALSSSADPQASSFIQYLISDEAQKLMRSYGYVR
ncbi:substrate-binding domain-containing protein [Synechococcus lacustris]|uniref:substrate-binding domain-containing protein n=1 Tax=Synechococcus lacustris TaxID=2116544 RepID=UPI0020CCE05F|nr:substrate-binding domain-containing protein [Synechococcus lacustris]